MNATTKNDKQPTEARSQPMAWHDVHVTTEERFTADDLERRRLADIISSTLGKQSTTFDKPVPSISRLSTVRISDQATTTAIARGRPGIHSPAPSTIFQPYSDYSPYSSSPSTAVNSRAPSPTKELDKNDEADECIKDDRLKWRLASGFFAYFLGGWADGVTGTVMPYLSAEFNLTSTLSSSLFAGTTCGFFAGTLLVEFMMKVLGSFKVCRSKSSCFPLPTFRRRSSFEDGVDHSKTQARYMVLIIASVIHAMYFVMMGSRSGFQVMFLAYVFSAFSRSLLTAPLNAYFAQGPKQALGYGLGLASLGSVISPLVCQSVIAAGVPWYRFYYGSLVLSVLNIVLLASTFRRTPSEKLSESQQLLSDGHRRQGDLLRSGRSSMVSVVKGEVTAPIVNVEPDTKSKSALRCALVMPYQWAFSFFIFIYCGSETTTQGFMVTFLLSVRHANPKTIGYVTSGFWGGISIGRFIWGYCTPRLSFTQRKYAVHACILVSVLMHVTIWIVKSSIANAVTASLIGALYGPIFPACLSMANDILPPHIHMVSMALISSFASLGGAIFPLAAGAMLDTRGIKTLTYLNVPLAAAMACIWTLFPSRLPLSKQISA